MSTFDALKKQWNEAPAVADNKPLDNSELFSMIRKRSKKQINAPVRYFWGAMVLQIILYAILVHIIVRYNDDSRVVVIGLIACILHLPFTYLMVRKFSRLAIIKPVDLQNAGASLKDYVSRQKEIISEFYSFKKKYELFLIPVSTIIGIYLFFTIFFPGGIMAYWEVAVFLFFITLITSVLAILNENRKQFDKPLKELQQILDDFEQD